MLKVQNLSVSFGQTKAVDGVSFDIKTGEIVSLVGESGSGKSVTALSILQLLPKSTAIRQSGSITFKDTELMNASAATMQSVRGNKIAMIFQEPMTSLNPLHTIGRQIAETLILHKGMSKKEARGRTLQLLELAGMSDAAKRLDSYPHEFSGGQRQRIMIAMALANEPDLLIADEPTTALDVTIQAQILELLADLRRKFNMAILLITHDLGIVRKMADKVCVMQEGRIVEQSQTVELFRNPKHPYTIKLLNAVPKGNPPPLNMEAPIVLEARKVNVRFPIKSGFFKRAKSHMHAVQDVSFSIRKGQTLGIVGESGSGKSSLGQALLRLINSTGEIEFEGDAIHELSQGKLRPLRRQMQIVFQDPFSSLNPRMSVGQIVSEGLYIQSIGTRKEREAMTVKILEEVGLDASALHRYPHEFSGGQRQRIAIARAMILKPKLVILDEPTSALDMSIQAQIIDLLRELQRKHDLTYMIISHDLRIIRAMASEVLVMKDGRVVEHGNADRIFEKPEQEYTRALLSAVWSR